MTELDLPAIGLGTSGLDDAETCAETVAHALDAGYRHVDTAQMYDNERAVGEGIRRSSVDRDEVVVATKIHPDNLAYDDAVETARESLDRLGLDRVDMLYVHWPLSAYEPEDTLPAMDDLREDGVTDHVCVSNFTTELLAEARDILDSPIAAHQVECHPLLPQRELREVARDWGHSLVAYSPLGQGDLFDHPVLSDVADKHDVHVAAVCLAWAAAQDVVVPIPKARGDHVTQNHRAVRDVTLDEEDLARIAAIEERTRIVDPDSGPWN